MGKPVLVIGRGVVGSIFAGDERFELRSHEEWESLRVEIMARLTEKRYGGYICAAGIAGREKCDAATMQDVMDANVGLPVSMLRVARASNVPYITFSTAGVYRSYAEPCDEDDDLHPHNRYTASKLAMEHALDNYASGLPIWYEKLFTLRIPRVIWLEGEHNFRDKCRHWSYCEDAMVPLVYPKTILRATETLLSGSVPGGTYNLASEVVYLPEFLEKECGWEGTTVAQGALQVTPNPQLSLARAQKAGLI